MRKQISDFDIISEIPQQIPSTSTPTCTQNNEPQSIETVPPKPNNSDVVHPSDSNPELTCLTCCCLYGRDETFSNPTSSVEKDLYCTAASKTLQNCLSSVMIYCYILLFTFILILLLLGELLLTLHIIVVPDPNARPTDNVTFFVNDEFPSQQKRVLFAVHWTNFAILALFFFEILLRAFAWRLDLVKSFASALDCAAVTVSFVSNITTTAVAGYDNPFNALSLLIIIRFVQIFSLIETMQRRVKNFYEGKLTKVESNTAMLQVANQKLNRQLSEKDYEIKQLRGHLGNLDDETHQQIIEGLKKKNEVSRRFDEDMEKAIALSKKEFEEANGGYTNPAYTLHNHSDGFLVPEVTIHHRENSIRKKEDIPSTSKSQPTSRGDIGDSSAKETTGHHLRHGELHAGADSSAINVPEDTALLLTRDHWTVGYCIVQSHPPAKLLDDSIAKDKGVKKTNLLSDQDDEGIGVESSPVKINYKHKRSLSVNPFSVDDTSDQGCVSATSLCSESGYLSDDRGCQSASDGHSNAFSEQVGRRNLTNSEIILNQNLSGEDLLMSDFIETTPNEPRDLDKSNNEKDEDAV